MSHQVMFTVYCPTVGDCFPASGIVISLLGTDRDEKLRCELNIIVIKLVASWLNGDGLQRGLYKWEFSQVNEFKIL